ncbi:hypothetical protein ACHAW5_005311 [Stephanodiscus triporus]|uniref:Uncharacterized protein n=1 Tax=Stephanodiscus triporus TaxID=2934178 RepID=A0ABD3NB18_9STRA
MEDDDESSSESRSSYSVSGDSQEGSTLSGNCSLDSIGLMLRRLEDDDSSLIDLEVDCKSIDADAAKCFSVLLPENTRLQRLRLDCGNDSSRLDVIRRVVSGLKGNSSIKHVEINDLTMDRDTSSWMAQSFASSKSLTHISMTKCRFLGSGLGILFVSLQHSKYIRHLTFHSCDWEEHNTEIVASSLPLLKLLSLSLVGINIALDTWPFLLNNIKRSKELILLDLSRNKMDDSIISSLAKTLSLQGSISTLVLSSCGLDDNCIKELAKGLRKHSPLSSLDVSNNNHISGKGVIYFRDMMKFNTSITELKVNGCGLNDRSLDVIESSLRYNNSVLKTFLSEDASQAIFGVVDMIGHFDIGQSTRNIVEAVSFGSDSAKEGTKEKKHVKNRLHYRRKLPDSSIKHADQTPPGQGPGSFTKGKEAVRYTMKSTTPEIRDVLL